MRAPTCDDEGVILVQLVIGVYFFALFGALDRHISEGCFGGVDATVCAPSPEILTGFKELMMKLFE
jgi:hypothetical protein